MRIVEIFYSINGESSYAGFPFVIARTAGCNLDCSFCDTPHARSLSQGEEMTVEEVAAHILRFGCPMVLLTGGEPLLQPEIPLLADRLLQKEFTVLLETNGSLPVESLDRKIVKVVDLKCPSSGMSDRILWENLEALTSRDQIKFVVKNTGDLEWMHGVIKAHSLEQKAHILVSPVFDSASLPEIAGFLMENRIRARIQLQLHKYIWGKNAKR